MMSTGNKHLALDKDKEKYIVNDFKFDEVYKFLETGADYEYWYTDFNYRIRHNGAKLYLIVNENRIISSSVLSFIYDSNAVLSGVKTSIDMRNKGYGSLLIKHILNDFSGNIYLMREKDKNYTFYNNIGFKDVGTWKIYSNTLK